VVAGARADDHLTRLKEWLHRHSGHVTGVILVLVAIIVLYKGVRGL
jgi:hypothetical protein